MTVLGDSHLTTVGAADFLGVCVRTLEVWRTNRMEGRTHLPLGPAFIRIGRKIYYLRSELQRYEMKGEPLSSPPPSSAASHDSPAGAEVEGVPRAPLLPLPRSVPPPR